MLFLITVGVNKQILHFFPLIPELQACNKGLTYRSHSNPTHKPTYKYTADNLSSFCPLPRSYYLAPFFQCQFK
jgi:hypothetical protein